MVVWSGLRFELLVLVEEDHIFLVTREHGVRTHIDQDANLAKEIAAAPMRIAFLVCWVCRFWVEGIHKPSPSVRSEPLS